MKKFLGLIVYLLMPALAFANTPEEIEPGLLTFWGSFIIYLVLLFFVLRKPTTNAWARRRLNISTAIQNNEAILLKAEKRLADARIVQRGMLNEVEQIKFAIAKDAETEAEIMLRDAREQAERITRQSHESVVLERRSSLAKSKKKIIEEVFDNARKIIKDGLTKEKDNRLQASALKTFTQVYH
jgi:F0F1-type ATP synthase membrane subunit b/b'